MARRLGIAFFIALLVHIVLAFWIRPAGRVTVRDEASRPLTFVHVVHRPHRPRPVVTPRPLRKKIVVVVHARSYTRPAMRARNHGYHKTAAHAARVLARAREIAITTTRPELPVAHHVGVSTLAGSGTVSGLQGATGAGSGGADGRGDAGAGTGVRGNGSGDGTAPCGGPIIIPRGPIKTYAGFEHVNVGIQLELRNGTRTPEVLLPYPLLYHNDAESPFSARNFHADLPVMLQPPPASMDQSNFPELIKMVLAATDAQGNTHFDACPQGQDADGPP